MAEPEALKKGSTEDVNSTKGLDHPQTIPTGLGLECGGGGGGRPEVVKLIDNHTWTQTNPKLVDCAGLFILHLPHPVLTLFLWMAG